MKKLLLLLITLITLTNVSFASFPISENNTYVVLTATNLEDPDDDDNEPSLLVFILRGILIIPILLYGFYLLFRAWWRAWKKRKRWARLLPWAILIAIPILGLIGLSLQGSGMGG